MQPQQLAEVEAVVEEEAAADLAEAAVPRPAPRRQLCSLVAAAHGPLIAHLKFQGRPEYDAWLKESFRKAVDEGTDEEFEQLKSEQDYITVTEDTWADKELAHVFCPREKWSPIFKSFPFVNY